MVFIAKGLRWPSLEEILKIDSIFFTVIIISQEKASEKILLYRGIQKKSYQKEPKHPSNYIICLPFVSVCWYLLEFSIGMGASNPFFSGLD